MNCLLIYPKNPEGNFWYFDSIVRRYLQNFKFLKRKRKATYIPLGLLTVAAIIHEKFEKWILKLIDLNVEELIENHIKWADVVFISAMIVQKENTQEIIRRCKALGKIVIAGGPLFTTQYNEFSEVDHLILNEAEVTLPLFLKDLKENKPKRIYTSKERADLGKSPIPAFWLINLWNYVAMSIQTNRGCPFYCEFCGITSMLGHKVRTKTPSQVLVELQTLYDIGWRGSIFIVDDNLIGNIPKAREMLREISQWQKKNGYPFKFLTQVSINLAKDEELVRLFIEANIGKVFVGIESPDPKNLDECEKIQNINIDMLSAIKKLLTNGIQVMAGLIYGFDKDNEETRRDLEDFTQRSGIVNTMPNLLTALPETRFWERLRRENRLLLESSSSAQINKGLNFLHQKKEEIKINYHRLLENIYSRRNYYKRIDTFLRYYKHKIRDKIFSWSNLIAFLKSIFYIGIFSRENIYYWMLIIKLIISRKKRKSFGVAIEMAISGKNFFKMAKMF
jgi:radical SAM superfamily enzyme YgiQ (UPF0313 family)